MENVKVNETKKKKPIYKRWWFWTIIVLIVLAGIGNISEKNLRERDGGQNNTTDTYRNESIQAERGVIENGMYRNETFGFAFPVQEDMLAASDEEIARMTGVVLEGQDVYTAEQIEQAMGGVVYDAVITNADATLNVVVSFQNMDITRNGMYASTEDEINALKEQYAGEGAKIGEVYSKILGDQEYTCIEIQEDGISQIFCGRTQDNYMLFIIVSSETGNAQIQEEFMNSIVSIP